MAAYVWCAVDHHRVTAPFGGGLLPDTIAK
jgi:hypothetical protein